MKCGAETTQKKPKGKDGTGRTAALTDTVAPGPEGQCGASKGPAEREGMESGTGEKES